MTRSNVTLLGFLTPLCLAAVAACSSDKGSSPSEGPGSLGSMSGMSGAQNGGSDAGAGTNTGSGASNSGNSGASNSGNSGGSNSGSSTADASASLTSDAQSGAAFQGLHAVMGTNGQPGHIADQNGHTVILHGVDESGSENFCVNWGPPPVVFSPAGGPSPLTQDSLTAMKSWGINAVRIPMNEDCWLGINGVESSVGGANYQDPISQAVDLITNTNSMYVILDLHVGGPGTTTGLSGTPSMADMDHSVTFWQQVAAAYKNNGSVIFDLYNEPNLPGTPQQQYDCWENGSTSPNSGACSMVDFAVAGMQTLLSTVRQAGANNLVILGGTGVAALMEPWVMYAPTDTLSPPNIAASWHVYDDQGGCTSDPNSSLAILCPSTNNGAMGNGIETIMAAGYPIIVGETGYYACSTAGVGAAWWPFFLSWATAQQIGTVAWAWSDSNTPQLLTETTNFTPSANGQIYKNFLSCIASKTITPLTSCTDVPSTGCE